VRDQGHRADREGDRDDRAHEQEGLAFWSSNGPGGDTLSVTAGPTLGGRSFLEDRWRRAKGSYRTRIGARGRRSRRAFVLLVPERLLPERLELLGCRDTDVTPTEIPQHLVHGVANGVSLPH
jgi:hypothetical protein